MTKPATARLRQFLLTSGFTLLALNVAEAAVNRAPAIWGAPPKVAQINELYTFIPRAADADGDRLTFSIRNKPQWMWFDARSGRLNGQPTWEQRGRTFGTSLFA